MSTGYVADRGAAIAGIKSPWPGTGPGLLAQKAQSSSSVSSARPMT